MGDDEYKLDSWIDSFKNRVQSQKEWTKVDRLYIEAAVTFVEHNNHFNSWGGVLKKDVITFLHALKLQNTWKPSEEQMISLRLAVSGCSYDVKPLLELEKQLKKL